MPASMIRAPTGGSPKVIGSSIAMVATVPMPGSTPTRVPTSAPSKQKHDVVRLRRDPETQRKVREKVRHDLRLPRQNRGQSWNGRLSK